MITYTHEELGILQKYEMPMRQCDIGNYRIILFENTERSDKKEFGVHLMKQICDGRFRHCCISKNVHHVIGGIKTNSLQIANNRYYYLRKLAKEVTQKP